jgi:23S rRNA (uracil1939-C5)-methyltransferase
VGRLADGRAVFVPRTAPGDLVELGRLRLRARFARARVARLLEPGPGRVEPPCRHYEADECGGCQLQHLAPQLQLETKRAFVADALERIGKLRVTVPPVVAASEWWGYRSRVALAVGPGRRQAGFHPLEHPERVFPLDRCHLAAPPLMELWQSLRAHLRLLPPDVEQLLLRLDRSGGCHVVVKSRGEQAWTGGPRLGEFLAGGATVWWQPRDGAARVVAGDRKAFPATVFEQVNPGLGDRIRDYALEHLGDIALVHVWDLYAGVGETTDRLLARGATVESVELDRQAVEQGERRWRAERREPEESQRPEPAGATRHVGRVEEIAPRMRRPGAVVANPPRAGMGPSVTAELITRRPARLVYVSCDPATLARDLGRLCGTLPGESASSGTYRVVALQPFDLFPQTAHVETVAVLEA